MLDSVKLSTHFNSHVIIICWDNVELSMNWHFWCQRNHLVWRQYSLRSGTAPVKTTTCFHVPESKHFSANHVRAVGDVTNQDVTNRWANSISNSGWMSQSRGWRICSIVASILTGKDFDEYDKSFGKALELHLTLSYLCFVSVDLHPEMKRIIFIVRAS